MEPEFKQVIIVRRDLKLDRGKLSAQVAHGSLEAYKKANEKAKEEWEMQGSKKVVLRAESLQDLMRIKDRIKELKLPYAVIRDAGRTQLQPGTVTVLGIGPADSRKLDPVTKDLKLL
jgi:peptidyl-tRNA hydrolase, PTH2 family